MTYVLGEDDLEVTPAEDQHPIEAFPTDGADESFGEGPGREPGVSVPHQEPDRMSPFGEHHGEVACLLRDHDPIGLAVTATTWTRWVWSS